MAVEEKENEIAKKPAVQEVQEQSQQTLTNDAAVGQSKDGNSTVSKMEDSRGFNESAISKDNNKIKDVLAKLSGTAIESIGFDDESIGNAANSDGKRKGKNSNEGKSTDKNGLKDTKDKESADPLAKDTSAPEKKDSKDKESGRLSLKETAESLRTTDWSKSNSLDTLKGLSPQGLVSLDTQYEKQFGITLQQQLKIESWTPEHKENASKGIEILSDATLRLNLDQKFSGDDLKIANKTLDNFQQQALLQGFSPDSVAKAQNTVNKTLLETGQFDSKFLEKTLGRDLTLTPAIHRNKENTESTDPEASKDRTTDTSAKEHAIGVKESILGNNESKELVDAGAIKAEEDFAKKDTSTVEERAKESGSKKGEDREKLERENKKDGGTEKKEADKEKAEARYKTEVDKDGKLKHVSISSDKSEWTHVKGNRFVQEGTNPPKYSKFELAKDGSLLQEELNSKGNKTSHTVHLKDGSSVRNDAKGIELQSPGGDKVRWNDRDKPEQSLSINGENFRSTDGGKTFSGANGERFKAELKNDGSLKREFIDRQPKGSEIRALSGDKFTLDDKGALKEAEIKGNQYKFDSNQRVSESTVNGINTKFQYEGNSPVPKSLDVNGQKFEVNRNEKGISIVGKSTDADKLPKFNDSLHPAFGKASLVLKDDQGRVQSIQRSNGEKVEFGYKEGSEKLESIKTTGKDGKVEELRTKDGFNWEGKDGAGNPKSEQGIKSVDAQGRLTEAKIVKGEDGRNKIESTITHPGGKTDSRSVDLDVRLKQVRETLEGSWRGPNGAEKVDKLIGSFKDLSAPEIQLLNRAFNPENPDALKQQLLAKGAEELPKYRGQQSYRLAEIQGHLSRTGQPGELDAIKLFSDAAKANDDTFRNKDSVAQTTRQTLLGQTEKQRQDADAAIKRIYGQENGLDKFYETGPGKAIAKQDAFTKAVTDLASKKGADVRTPEEQSNLAKLALSSPTSIEYFRQATAPDAFSKEAREHFKQSGGFELIEKGFKREDGGYTAFTKLQQQELKDLAKDGKESPETQFAKGVGTVTSNAEEALKGAVKRVADDPELRAKYLNGEELAKGKTEPKTPEQKAALDYYNNWQELFKSAHYTYKDRKVDKFDSLIKNGPEGSFANGEIFKQGGNWFQNRGELFNSVEKATGKQLNPLFDGATINGDKVESGPLADALKSIKDNVNRAGNADDLQKLLTDKIKYGLEIGSSLDKLVSGSTIDPKQVSELKAKLPAFKDLSDEKFTSILEGYRLQRSIGEGKQKEADLSAEQKKALSEFNSINKESKKDEILLKGFLQGREAQTKLDSILNDKALSAGERDAAASKYLKELSPESKASLEAYRQVRNEAVQANVRRTVEQALKDSEGSPELKFQALKDASPAELQRLATDKDYRAQILEQFRNPETGQIPNSAKYLLELQSQGRSLTQAEKFTVEQLQKAASNGERLDTAEALKALQAKLNEDKDGKFAKELAANENAIKILDESSGGYLGKLIKSSTERGFVTAAEWQQAQSTFSKAKDLFTGGRDLATDSILGAHPNYLKHLSGEQGKKEREQLLSSLSPERKALFEQIIKQGEVKPEDKLRAFHLGLIKQDEAINPFKELDASQRTKGIQDYHSKYGSSAKEDLLGKVEHADKAQIDLLFTENKLDSDQALIRSREQVSDSANTFLGRIAQRYDASATEQVNELAKDIKENGGELSQEKLDAHLKEIAEKLKNFEEIKEQTADQLIETAVTIAAGAATPFTGGASLSLLTLTTRVGSLALRGGLAATFGKAALTGDYDPTKLAGDFVKYSALTAGNALGAEGIVALSRLGGKVASSAIGKTFEDASLAALKSPQIEETLKKGLGKLIEEGATAGGVKDAAVLNLVKSIEGLSPSAQEALASSIIKNLSPAIKEVASDSLKGILINTGRAGRTAVLDGAGAYVGDVAGDLVRQSIEKGDVNLSQALEGAVKTFALAGVVRGGVESFKLVRSGAREASTETVPRSKADNSAPREKAAETIPAKDTAPASPDKPHIPKEWPERLSKDITPPAVPDGHVRLYRGVQQTEGLKKEFAPNATPQERQRWWDLTKDLSGKPGDFEKLPATIQKELKELLPKINSPDIKFYTDDIKTAQKYAGKDGHLLYVDIPKEDLFKYRKENHGLAAAGSAGETFQVPAKIHSEKAGRVPSEDQSASVQRELRAAPARQDSNKARDSVNKVERPEPRPPRPEIARLQPSAETVKTVPLIKRSNVEFAQGVEFGHGIGSLKEHQTISLGRAHAGQGFSDPLISREHAVLGKDSQGTFIIDKSQHGTFVSRDGVNAERLPKDQKYYLKPGEDIWLSLKQKLELQQPKLQDIDLGPSIGRVSENVPLKIGRKVDGINSSAVSRDQAELVRDANGLLLTSNSASNGTYIVRTSGTQRELISLKKGEQQYLRNGDEVWFGHPNKEGAYKLETSPTRKTLSNGIEIEKQNGLAKVKFPDGTVAERLPGGGWHEHGSSDPKSKYRAEAFNKFNGSYRIDAKDGTVTRIGPSEYKIFFPDGKIGSQPNPNVFQINGAMDRQLVNKFYKAFADLPEKLRDKLVEGGQKISIGNKLTALDPSLKGQIPRGHGPNGSWSRIEGLHDPKARHVLLAEEFRKSSTPGDYTKTHRPEGVLRHEVGHALDQALGELDARRLSDFSNSPEFIAAYEKDLKNHLSKLSQQELDELNYFHQHTEGQPLDLKNLGTKNSASKYSNGRSEAFAELFGIIYGGGGSAEIESLLKRAFPNTKSLIESRLAEFHRY